MKTFAGMTQRALNRRWASIERLSIVDLYKDRYGNSPSVMSLSLAERTHYRAAAWLLDNFTRPNGELGSSYSKWAASGFAGLTISNNRVIPAATGTAVDRFEVHALTTPRDQWAEVAIKLLDGDGGAGHYASVGVVLRSAEPNCYVAVAANDNGTFKARLGRYVAGVVTWIAESVVPWALGDVIKATAEWSRFRIYRNNVLVLEHTDTTFLTSGLIGVQAGQALSGDFAALDDFVGGPLRHEYLGTVADMGDVQHTLNKPMSFDMSLSNLTPMGGADRFAKLLRHGLNQTGAFDVGRGSVRVLTALDGTSAPIVVANGLIEAPTDMTEDRVRLVVRGRDAFLTPKIEPGNVNYLPGPPLSSGPPPEECQASGEVIIPGGTPSEPPDESELGPDTPQGLGPEATAGGSGGSFAVLVGAYLIQMEYTLDFGGGPQGQDVYVGTTEVTELPLSPGVGTPPRDLHDDILLRAERRIGLGSEQFPEYFKDVLWYRGPDVVGSHLDQLRQLESVSGGHQGVTAKATVSPAPANWSIPFKMAEYSAAGIKTVESLEALRPRNPTDPEDPFPPRIQTLATHTIDFEPLVSNCSTCYDPIDGGIKLHLHTHAGGGAYGFLTTWEQNTMPVDYLALGTVPLLRFAGPQLVRVELDSPAVSSTTTVTVALSSSQNIDELNVPSNTGTPGSNGIGCALGFLSVHRTDAPRLSPFGLMSVTLG